MADSELTAKMIGMKEARKSLSHLVKEVKTKNTRYLLSVRGKPQAVLLIAQYMYAGREYLMGYTSLSIPPHRIHILFDLVPVIPAIFRRESI